MAMAFRARSFYRKDAVTGDDASDEQLIATGDTAVFAQLYDRYVDGVYAYCRLRLPNAAEAEDATATVFEKAFAAYPPAPTGSFKGWLFTIAHNVVVSYYRTRSRRGYHQPIEDVLYLTPARCPPACCRSR